MARKGPGVREDDSPGQIRGLAPQFAVNEVADAAEKQSLRNQGRDEVSDIDEMAFTGLCEVAEGQGQAYGRAVE